MNLFNERKAIIATMHKKESVIAPILEKELGLICTTTVNINTDSLGTFTGEIERIDGPIACLRKKCNMALEINSDISIAIASEGSFGMHPSIFYVTANEELIMLIDKENGLEIIERELSLNTNFNSKQINSENELIEFANKIGFPSHGIILKNKKDNFSTVLKDAKTLEDLIEQFNSIQANKEGAYVETDMRAMNNPTRMSIIEIATNKLTEKAKSKCPNCEMPGFGVVESIKGLICELCGKPTNSTLAHVYRCQKCKYEKIKTFPLGKEEEEAQYCDYCNP